MNYSITKSVGLNGYNHIADVLVIQRLLNKFAELAGYPVLKANGIVDNKMINAIKLFQLNVVKVKNTKACIYPYGDTLKKLNEPVTQTYLLNDIKNKGLVTGKTDGVSSKLIDYLTSTADYFQTRIVVTSGKRSPAEQAKAMWNNWDKHLERGLVYKFLRTDKLKRKELDTFFKNKNKKDFFNKVIGFASSLSSHLAGRAADVSLATDTKVIKALGVDLKYVEEKHKGIVKCHHFQLSGKKQGKITNGTKIIWKRLKNK